MSIENHNGPTIEAKEDINNQLKYCGKCDYTITEKIFDNNISYKVDVKYNIEIPLFNYQ